MRLLRYAVDVLERLNVPYMLVESLASGIYRDPRLTQDIDFEISPQAAQLEQLCAAFSPDDFYVSREAASEALRNRGQFNVLDPSSGNKIDFMILTGRRLGQRADLGASTDAIAARPGGVRRAAGGRDPLEDAILRGGRLGKAPARHREHAEDERRPHRSCARPAVGGPTWRTSGEIF